MRGIPFFGPYLVEVRYVTKSSNEGRIFLDHIWKTFQQGIMAFQRLNDSLYFSFQLVLNSVKSIMSFPTKTTYVTSFPRGTTSREPPTKFSSLTTFWITWRAVLEPKRLQPLGPSTQDPYVSSISLPPRSITIYPVHPLLSLGTHPTRKVNSA